MNFNLNDSKNTNILLVIVIGLLIWILVNSCQNKTRENFNTVVDQKNFNTVADQKKFNTVADQIRNAGAETATAAQATVADQIRKAVAQAEVEVELYGNYSKYTPELRVAFDRLVSDLREENMRPFLEQAFIYLIGVRNNINRPLDECTKKIMMQRIIDFVTNSNLSADPANILTNAIKLGIRSQNV